MKPFLAFSLLVVVWMAKAGYAQTVDSVAHGTAPAEEPFSAKGTITEVNQEDKVLRVKIEGGLELTFHTDEATVIRKAEGTGTFKDLMEGGAVEMEYVYNENYEKVAQAIRLTSAEKNGPPPV